MAIMPTERDYSPIGRDAEAATRNGLAAAWYQTDIPRKRMKELMRRSDGPAIRDTIIWLAAFVVFGAGGYLTWGTGPCGRCRSHRLRRALRAGHDCN